MFRKLDCKTYNWRFKTTESTIILSTIVCMILKLNNVLWWLRDWTAKVYEQQQKFRYARKLCGKLGAGLRILVTTYIVRVGGCTCCNTRFPPKNL